MHSHGQHPWSMPVPVRSGRFESLFSEHRHCNVVVASDRIGSFGAGPHPAPENLLYADLQTNLFLNITGRLGSGRSGFYRGLYLKGIGRTVLAGNWTSSDYVHNTGHLTASSAIREYVISVYLKTVGGEKTIVPCQGVLLGPLSPELSQLRDLLIRDFPEEALPAADGAIQAITVKSGTFARISNFAWLLHHLTPRSIDNGQSSISRFAQLLAAALSDADSDPPSDISRISPKYLVTQLETAIERVCKHFQLWLDLGVWWGSFGNNLTLDGRFLDLETPSVAGGVFLGRLGSRRGLGGRTLQSSIIGTEVFYYLLQMRRFCQLAVRTLSGLPHFFHPIEQEFAGALAEEIQARLLGENSVIVSRSRALELALKLYWSAVPSLSPAALKKLQEILADKYDRTLGKSIYSSPSGRPRLSGIPLKVPLILSEPGVRWRFRALRLEGDEAIMPSPEAQERAGGLHALIDDLDATTDVDELLSKLDEIENKVRVLVGDTASSTSGKAMVSDRDSPRLLSSSGR